MDANDKTNLRESKVDHDVDAGGGQGKQGKDSGCVICAPLEREKKISGERSSSFLSLATSVVLGTNYLQNPRKKLTGVHGFPI